jgi:hypothetical protein
MLNFGALYLPNSCPNAQDAAKAYRWTPYLTNWTSIYLHQARTRLNKQLHGYELTHQEVYSMQGLCVYEVHPVNHAVR